MPNKGAFTPHANRYVAEQWMHEAHVDGPCSTLAYAKHPSLHDTAWNVVEFIPPSRCVVAGHIDTAGRYHESCLI